MTVIAAKWTIEEYHRMVAAGILCDLALGEALRDRSVELLKGEIIEMPRPREPSAYCSDEAGEYLTSRGACHPVSYFTETFSSRIKNCYRSRKIDCSIGCCGVGKNHFSAQTDGRPYQI